ncbi:MAG: hypothetical protein KJP10_07340, partial [Gammaproteobacteria bacterium]|nr:hypothetical protein [Gammaproteobacteria bacterium]
MLRQLAGLIAFCVSAPAIAGGPLLLEGPNGNVPAKYQDPNIVFNIEIGELGPIPNPAADLLVMDALSIWNSITTSTISLTQGADVTIDGVAVDIDETNFTRVIPDPNNTVIHNDDDGQNPIVYDADGSIVDAFFGIGQGTGPDASVVGFAASSIIIGSSFFTEGFAVINGNSNLRINDDQRKLIVAHEIGHFLGLDHTQTNIDNSESFFDSCRSADPPVLAQYPLMYPYACRTDLSTLVDDDAALATLYPQADFYASQGQLTGRFITTDGAAIRGANLWVEDRLTGEVFSIVSDYLTQCTGFFALMLPPGEYILHANSVNREFYGGSSVGPYANSATDLSFQAPASTIGSD